MPLIDEFKNKWIESISQHQSFCPINFMICERHFTANDFTPKLGRNDKKMLCKEAVPSIYDENRVEPVLSSSPNDRRKTENMRYCKIKNCTNEIGTLNKQILFFR